MCRFIGKSKPKKETIIKPQPDNNQDMIATILKPSSDLTESLNKTGLRIAFIVGHTKLKPGAKGFQNYAENHFHRKIAEKYLTNYHVYYHKSYNLGYTAMCKETASRINSNGKYDLIFALHFNSSDSPVAHGAETWHYFSNKRGQIIGKAYLLKLCKVFNLRNRGIKALVNSKQRGFAEVASPKSTVVLLEPFFSSNEEESKKFTVDTYGKFLEKFADNLYLKYGQ